MQEKTSIFDSHFHIIDPQYPLIANQGYLPNAFTAYDYQQQLQELNLNVQGGAVVSGSFQAFDTQYLVKALSLLGPNYVGVVNLPHNATDDTIMQLHDAGVRAVRFNCYRGGSETVKHLATLARRVYDLARWHIELYISNEQLVELKPTLLSLPQVSIDHLGLTERHEKDLLELVAAGAKVKATRFSILTFDIAARMRRIIDINPDALMFGTDLPGTRAPRPFAVNDIRLLQQEFNESLRHKILYTNAYQLYHGRFMK